MIHGPGLVDPSPGGGDPSSTTPRNGIVSVFPSISFFGTYVLAKACLEKQVSSGRACVLPEFFFFTLLRKRTTFDVTGHRARAHYMGCIVMRQEQNRCNALRLCIDFGFQEAAEEQGGRGEPRHLHHRGAHHHHHTRGCGAFHRHPDHRWVGLPLGREGGKGQPVRSKVGIINERHEKNELCTILRWGVCVIICYFLFNRVDKVRAGEWNEGVEKCLKEGLLALPGASRSRPASSGW